MAYIGDTFGAIRVQVEKDGLDMVRIDDFEITFEDAESLASFVMNEIHEVKRNRGDYDRW